MVAQDQSPATKEDVQGIMEYLSKNDEGIHLVQKELASLRKDMDKRFVETHHQFGVVAEDIKHNFQGAFHDKIEQHEDRIIRLEQHVGMAA